MKAQEMTGLTLGNYSGPTVLLINPAMMTNTHDFLSINIISGDLFVQNNFAYIPAGDYTVWDAVMTKPLPVYDGLNNILYYDNQNLKNAVVNLRIMGPSAMLHLGDHAFGITSGLRINTSGNSIPWEIPVFAYEGINYKDLYNIQFNDNNFDFQSNAWGEIGLSYAYNIIKYFDQQLTIGISAKYLMGLSGAYSDIKNAKYIIQNDSVMNVQNLDAELGFALPIDYNTNEYLDSGPLVKGSGMGLDIGVVYVKRKYADNKNWNRLCEQPYEEYKYRIGVSILDIGGINYKNNAQLHSYDNVNVLLENSDTINFSNINQVIGDISDIFYGDPNASLIGNSFKIGLPTAISIQADFNIQKNFFISGFWIHPIRLNAHTLRRPAELSIIPRIETHYFDFSLPITLYEYNDFRMGAAIRLYFITIGTDNLGTWVGTSNLDGMDLYVSLKFGLSKGGCKPVTHNKCYNNEYEYSRKQKKGFRR